MPNLTVNLGGARSVTVTLTSTALGVATLTCASGCFGATDVGPLASRQVLDDLERQVRSAREQGAKVACGGERLQRSGFFFAPTVMLDAEGEVHLLDIGLLSALGPTLVDNRDGHPGRAEPV